MSCHTLTKIKLNLISTNIMALYHKQPPKTSPKGQSLQVDARVKCYIQTLRE